MIYLYSRYSRVGNKIDGRLSIAVLFEIILRNRPKVTLGSLALNRVRLRLEVRILRGLRKLKVRERFLVSGSVVKRLVLMGR